MFPCLTLVLLMAHLRSACTFLGEGKAAPTARKLETFNYVVRGGGACIYPLQIMNVIRFRCSIVDLVELVNVRVGNVRLAGALGAPQRLALFVVHH